MHTQVAIIGAGPAGLMLAHLLHLYGIESLVLERRSRDYVERRLRAGVLEQNTVDLLNETGVGERMRREGLIHHGFALRFAGETHRIDIHELTGGRAITVYGQQEVVKDLIAARLAYDAPIVFEAEEVSVHELTSARPSVRYRHAGRDYTLHCDYVAGCDGFHGVSRSAIPTAALRIYQKSYPCAWLGILAATPPASEELIYAYHERGFALQSMRSPTISRLYVQCAPDDEVENWTDEQIWQELRARLATEDSGEHLEPGPILERGVTAMRSFVAEPLRYGRLFLAGDAAHTVPPTGAKGMNLAIADVRVLAEAFARFYRRGSTDLLDAYSATCLRRIWRVQHFSWWMTTLLHQLGDPDDDFQHQIQLANLRSVVSSRAGATYLAENYVGLERV